MTDGFNGWTDWATWNVALWIGNERAWYDASQRAIMLNPDLQVAAAALQIDLPMETPDGAEVSFVTIREAIADDHADYWDTQ